MELTLEVGAVAHGGHWVARHEGRVVFVRHALAGEVVLARLTEHDDGATFWRADTVEVLRSSPDRIAHPWGPGDALAAAAAGRVPVGGAEYGHIALPAQRRLKAEVLAEQLDRLAGIPDGGLPDGGLPDGGLPDGDLPGTGHPAAGQVGSEPAAEPAPDASPDGMGWRTRMSFSIDAQGRLGMHPHRSSAVQPIEAMPLAVRAINDLQLWTVDFTGIARLEVAAPENGSTPLILLVPAEGSTDKAVAAVAARVPVGVSVAAWTPPSDRKPGSLNRLRGRTWLAETAVGRDYRVTGDGFWQIHRRAPEVLIQATLAALDPRPGERIADLYAGAGLFSAPLAEAVGETGSVLSVESSAGTSRDARKNLHIYPQVRIERGKVDRVLQAAAGPDGAGGLDLVLLDPPRVGAGKSVVRRLADSGARAVGYISCDPASFARDVGYFRRAGWRLEMVRVFDLYPNTHHLETFGLLVPASRRTIRVQMINGH